jgi:hypothetical protein
MSGKRYARRVEARRRLILKNEIVLQGFIDADPY